MALPFNSLSNAYGASTVGSSLGQGLSGLGLSAASSMGNNATSAGQMGSMVANMGANVKDQEAMMAQVTQMQNELNYAMAMDQLAKQAGANAKSLTQG